ncbi:tetratricopeptide repeat protein [Catenulispora subtropica]|uniref:Tetratricopeptide repeat protein n=1 Tax=Catenulispora subtropica TaxID=450798 RepID=A0ABN2QZC1_9ACTN
MTTSAGDRDARLAEAVALRASGDEAKRRHARELLIALSAELPDDAEVAYQTAWVHDVLGLEAEAVPFYERALAGSGLPEPDRRGARLGHASTLRSLGRYPEAVEAFRAGLAEFPDDNALRTFLAMALYNVGEHHEAMRTLLETLAATSADPWIQRYRPAIEHYARDLDAVG